MLTRNPIKAIQTVKILTDPNPQFVSLVGHGANQTPFLTIKTADKPAPTMTTKAAPAPQQSSVTKGNEAKTEIHKIIFAADKFPTTEAVTSYLTAKSYEGFTIDAIDGGGFVVKGISEDAFKSISPIVGEDGVTMFVGELTTPIAKTEAAPAPAAEPTPAPAAEPPAAAPVAEVPPTEEPAPGTEAAPAPAAEQTETEKAAAVTARTRTREGAPMLSVKSDKLQARKVDTWLAYYDTNELTIAGVLADANDGIPVGFYDIENAFLGALKNLVLAGNVSGIKTLTAEFGNIIQKLAGLTAGVEKADDRAEATKSLFAAPKGTVAPVVVAKGDDATATALAELKTLLVKSQEETKLAREEASKAAARVTSLEQIRQTRKSADTSEVSINAPAAKSVETPAPTVNGKRSTAAKMADNLAGIC